MSSILHHDVGCGQSPAQQARTEVGRTTIRAVHPMQMAQLPTWGPGQSLRAQSVTLD